MFRTSHAVVAQHTGHGHGYCGSSRAAPRHAGAALGFRQIPDAVQGEPPPLGTSYTPSCYVPPTARHALQAAPWQAIDVKPRSVWAAMDDGADEEEIFAVADQVFALVDTDKSGDIQVSELKAILLADDWDDALVEKVFTGIDFDDSGEIDRDELRTAFVKHPSLRSALGKQTKA